MCGIVGLLSRSPVNQCLYDSLMVLQHRGQDAAGMMTHDGQQFYLRKSNGLVRDVFRRRHMENLAGHMGIGHVRYPTAGSSSGAEAQPFYVNSPYGICLAHNGNLTNSKQLKEALYKADLRHINTGSDSEILLNVFAHELQKIGKLSLNEQDIFQAMRQLFGRVRGGFAAVLLIKGYGMVAFRDPHGIRPLVFGKKNTPTGVDYMVASESAALSAAEFKLVRDVAPGEVIFFHENGKLYQQNYVENSGHTPCIFEYVYLARPDSVIDDVSVYEARLRMGEKLANNIRQNWPDHGIDVVIPIPETSRIVALPLAGHLGVPYREGFVKNRYIGRTFIMPGQKQRGKSVRQKLNVLAAEFKNKNVLLVDDSVVRGTTSREIVQMAREAGAKHVYFASACPPIRYPNVYGIDMAVREELVAFERNDEQIAQQIGVDKIIYQTLDDLNAAVGDLNPAIKRFESAIFDGCYITGDIDERYMQELADLRNDKVKSKKAVLQQQMLDLNTVVD